VLTEINEYLKKMLKNSSDNYCVPFLWLSKESQFRESANGHKYYVNPYDFFSKSIKQIQNFTDIDIDYSLPM